jgi:hypothetical protein
MVDLPVACTLSPVALKARRENLLNALLQRATERSDLPDGCRLQFAPDEEILADIARTIEAERRCCRFLEFQLTIAPDLGPITLELTGPAGTREFLADLFNSA